MIDKSTIDRIFSTADIVDIVSDFVTLKKKGINYQACCPFHNEKTPSFVVSPAKGVFKCFGCGKGGNAVSFVMEHEHLNYVDALKYVAKKYGIEIAERPESEQDKKINDDRESMMVVTSYASEYFARTLEKSSEGKNIGLSYFYERGFTDATIAKFQLGYCLDKGDAFSTTALEAGYKEEFLVRTGLTIKRESGGYYDRFAGRVIFPVHSLSGRVNAFGGRTLRTDKKTAKYVNSPESEIYHKSNSLYGIYFAKRAITHENRCILVEGYTDVISMHQAGIENVVASSGTSLTEDQIRLIKRFTNNITVIYDGDSAGIKASMRGIDMILKEGMNVRVVLLPEGADPDSFARSHSATEVNDFIVHSEEDFLSFKTKLLLGDAKNDPIARANVINDVVKSISIISDEITRSVYIKACSHLMDVDESVVSREVARKRVGLIDGEAGREVMRNQQRKEYHQQRSTAPSADDFPPIIPPEDTEVVVVEELERELVSYLLRYGDRDFFFYQPRQEPVAMNIAETIIGELQADNITFVNPVYRQIYEEYIRFLNEIKAEAGNTERVYDSDSEDDRDSEESLDNFDSDFEGGSAGDFNNEYHSEGSKRDSGNRPGNHSSSNSGNHPGSNHPSSNSGNHPGSNHPSSNPGNHPSSNPGNNPGNHPGNSPQSDSGSASNTSISSAKPTVSINSFINHSSVAVCDFVVNLLSQEDSYRASKIWAKQDIAVLTEAENLNIAVPKTISLYKLHVIDRIMTELNAELASTGNLEILQRMNALNTSRKAICEKYSRIIS